MDTRGGEFNDILSYRGWYELVRGEGALFVRYSLIKM